MNYILSLLSAAVISILPAEAALAQATDAPIGLVWGASASEIQAKGVGLKEIEGTDFGKSFTASNMDRALADQSVAILSFGFNDKLWRVLITSRPFSSDPAGSAVVLRYNELVGVLSEKYGKPDQVHKLGDSIYAQSAYFLAGIRGGESRWFSNFDTPSLFIQIGLVATDSATGNWRLIYENKLFRRDFETSKRSREKGAL
jgi:hypothetical protein